MLHNTIRTMVVVSLCLVFAGIPTQGYAWNEIAHRLYLEKAIDALPKPLKNFYKDRKNDLSEAIAERGMREGRLVFEVDRLEQFPFDELPLDRAGAMRVYGEEKISEAGDVPWRVAESYLELVEAFRSQDFETVQKLSVEIAYLVGEMQVPGNVSQIGDGDPTGQLGLRERFDSGLIDSYATQLKLDSPSARFLDRPAEYAVSIPRKSYVWVDNLLHHDEVSRRGVSSYDRFYYENLWLRSSSLVRDLLEDAALDTSSFWYTAWVAARKPQLPKK